MFQCHLDKEGASEMVVDLIINNHSSRIFMETVELGIALLEGGNSTIQVSTTSLYSTTGTIFWAWRRLAAEPPLLTLGKFVCTVTFRVYVLQTL